MARIPLPTLLALALGLVTGVWSMSAPLDWARVKRALDDLSANRPATRAGADGDTVAGPWAEALHQGPDVYLVHNFLSAGEVGELLHLHRETLASAGTDDTARLPWCFSSEAAAHRRANSLAADAGGVAVGELYRSKEGSTWCLPPAPVGSEATRRQHLETATQNASRSTIFVRQDRASPQVDALEARLDAALGLPQMHA